MDTRADELRSHLETGQVTFQSMSEKEIQDYVATGEPLDKAGAYAIQGIGRKFISQVEGDEEAIIGLPVKILKIWLKSYLPNR